MEVSSSHSSHHPFVDGISFRWDFPFETIHILPYLDPKPGLQVAAECLITGYSSSGVSIDDGIHCHDPGGQHSWN